MHPTGAPVFSVISLPILRVHPEYLALPPLRPFLSPPDSHYSSITSLSSFNEQTFTNVNVTAGEADPLYVPPSNFVLGTPPIYIDISTDAVISPPVLVCLTYATSAFPENTEPQIFHFIGERWVDATTRINTTAQIVCGEVQSLSPFAVGSLIITPDAFAVNRLRLKDKQNQKDAWTLSGLFETANITTNDLLEAMDGKGVQFEVYGQQGLISSVVFEGKNCRRIGRSASTEKLSCRMKQGQISTTARATFKQYKQSSRLFVKATFSGCTFDITTSLRSLTPLKVRIITPTSLGALDSPSLRCKESSSRMRCVAA